MTQSFRIWIAAIALTLIIIGISVYAGTSLSHTACKEMCRKWTLDRCQECCRQRWPADEYCEDKCVTIPLFKPVNCNEYKGVNYESAPGLSSGCSVPR